MKADTARAARELLVGCYDGVLATLSVDVAGYPFGSVVPYCLDDQARPVILIASIAQHTKNIRADQRVSLTVFDRDAPDLQANGRVTYIGDCAPLAAGAAHDAAAARYLRYFPEAASYDRTHDFAFHAITPRRLRFIGGFGEIHWFEPERALRPNPFDAAAESAIVDHMNADHADAVRHYCALGAYPVAADEAPCMVGCDGEGMNIRIGQRIVRIAFEHAVSDSKQVREVLVELARRPLPGGHGGG